MENAGESDADSAAVWAGSSGNLVVGRCWYGPQVWQTGIPPVSPTPTTLEKDVVGKTRNMSDMAVVSTRCQSSSTKYDWFVISKPAKLC